MRFKACHFASILALAVATLSCAANKTNILLVFVDDLGYGDLSCYGSETISTPNIDRLAEDGIRFSDAYVTSPVCGPSRVGLLTGNYPQRFGVYWNPDTTRAAIPAEYPLITETMRSVGYRTGVVGKWNITRDVYQSADYVRDPMIWGGDYWPREDGTYGGVGGGWGDSKEQGLWGPQEPGDEYLTDRLTQHAINFIEDAYDQPFFLYLAYNAPHSPLHAQTKFAEQVAHIDNEPMRLYTAMVLAIDEGVGRILESLDSTGQIDNTLVLFMSDNGPAAGDFKGYKPEWPQQVLGSTGRLRGHKRDHYEGGIRVPLIASWPGTISSGQRNDTPVSSLDFFTTFAAIGGADTSSLPNLDGINLLPLLTDPKHEEPVRDLYWANDDTRALRHGKWKLYYTDPAKPELYDLKNDPAETRNLARQEAKKTARFLKLHQRWLKSLPTQTDRTKPTLITPNKEHPLNPILP